jgi:hypothetical protein
MASLLGALKGGEALTTEKVDQKTTSVQEQTSKTNTSSKATGKESKPFNWASGFGNLFEGIGEN